MAFNEVLRRARHKAAADTDLILDICEALYRPSVDVGIDDTASLRGWRTTSVGLRGWRYVPPNAKKIPDLIGGLDVSRLGQISRPCSARCWCIWSL